jgi:hypothetical protein
MLKSPPQATVDGMMETEDFNIVVADPAAFYPEPGAILADKGLTRRQRLHLLTEWAQDIVDRQVAENEGMAPETIAESADETQLLRQVNAAIETVEASAEDTPGLITRVWRRLTRG